jgi:hypothetical protein
LVNKGNIMIHETDNEIRLRRAQEYLEHAREANQRAAQAAYAATEDFRKAKERVEGLYLKVEAEEVQRRKATYNHFTG